MPYQHSGFLQRNRRTLVFLYKVLDSLVIGISLMAGVWLRYGDMGWPRDYSVPILLAVFIFQLCAELNRTYRPWRGSPIWEEVQNVLVTWVQTLVVLLLLAFVIKVSEDYSRLAFGYWAVICGISLGAVRAGLRLVFRRYRSKGYNVRKVAIAGAGRTGKTVARQIHQHPWLGYELIGFYSDYHPVGERPIQNRDYAVQGTLDELIELAERGEVDQVYIAFGPEGFHNMREFVGRLANTTVSVFVVPDTLVFSLLKGQLADMAGMPIVRLYDSPFWGLGGFAKRAQDLALATVITMLISLPMLAIAFGVKATSRGPVLFRQRRYGLDGRQIEVWKFRTMTVCEDGKAIKQATKCDKRVTVFGGFLRRTSLDELPQFLNVLQGQMSIVGPRPHAVAHNEQFRDEVFGYMARHKVKPGITGWAQVHGWRGEIENHRDLMKRTQYDLWYIRNWSLGLDLKIVGMTILKGFVNKKAY